MKPTIKFAACYFIVNLILSACSSPAPTATQTQSMLATELLAPTETETLAPTETATSEPSATATATLLALEILEWSEFPYAHPADPSNTDTHVEVLIRNPNDSPVRVLRDRVELRFLDASGQVVYANPNPSFYIWQGSWMLPEETAALSACVCFETGGKERQAWESLELVAPLEIATDLAYTFDVEVTLGEYFGGSGLAGRTTLTNTSEHVLGSISMLVFARDTSGRYIGMVLYGDTLASFFTKDIRIQPGDTGTGVWVNNIEYFNGRMIYEVRAIGIIDVMAPTAEPPAGTPVANWQGIPIMPGAINGGEADDGYQFSTQATIDEIAQFYATALTELGYTLTTSGTQMGNTVLVFEKGSTTALIGISPSAEFNLVQITVLS